jgi:hypothetical protein
VLMQQVRPDALMQRSLRSDARGEMAARGDIAPLAMHGATVPRQFADKGAVKWPALDDGGLQWRGTRRPCESIVTD